MKFVGPIVAAVATLTPIATLALVCPDASASQGAKVQQKTTKKPVETTTFTSAVVPFLKKHCIPCHGPTVSKGGITLHDISRNLAVGKDMDLWNLVLKQLVLSEMPPSSEKQPLVSDVSKVVDWINAELNKSGNTASLYQKLEHPDYGNLVSHEKLFSGEIKTKPFSPARLWRTSPNVFDNIKSSYGGDARSIRQPFLVEDRKGIKEYANLLFADSAVVDVLLTNAGYCADQLIQKERLYRDIAAQLDTPNQEQLDLAASLHFKKVVFRDPTKDELTKYADLFKSSAKDGDNAEALRVMLMAIMLHPESVYRIEIGLGELDASGRRMLSPTELAFAISYALTDQRPDRILLQAAESGKLRTKEDVRAQISRLLEDESLEKPRILRFFQEFFGYNQAHIVFKDEARSGGFRYYGEDYPVIYERDADLFVLNILTKDKDVFRKLLTSDEYFILNRQTFRNTVYAFYEQNKEMIDKGQLTEAKSQELLKSLGLKGWKELNTKYYLHPFDRGFNGSPTAIKNMGKEIPTEGRIGHPDEGKTFQAVSQGMHIIYEKYPMAYDLKDGEQNFLLPQPYKRPNRSGMLTHPAWLISHSLNDISDPIRRGKWIRQRLLAGVVLDVPITVDATIPQDHHKTLRERLSVTEAKACWRCHEQMNPLGYTFEVFDDFGRYRTAETLDKLPKVNGTFPVKPVNSRGALVGTGEVGIDGNVKDALELIQKLANSKKVRQSIIRHVFRYYMGRNEMLSDSMTLIAADKAYLESGGSFKAILISLLTSDSFLYRKTLTKG